ncbi:RTC4-like domain-containing protein [Suillus lakei]|nr:RTC4-like domain-containing protein [Suillus lakei]
MLTPAHRSFRIGIDERVWELREGAYSFRRHTGPILIEDDWLDEDSYGVVDPSTMCPYCDEPLPLNPTPQMENLLITAKQKSHADSRPGNPRGLKAPLGIYISVCQQHHFETHSLPEAIEKGWPKSIDFKKVPKRVESMKSTLEDIITDADRCCDDEDSADDSTRGPRARSVFWRELKKEIKKQGCRAVTGVKGQIAMFEKTQPGYYGELGLLIIHQTLYNLFPFSSFDTSSIAPLTPADFVQLVLVPEAAVGLIMQDLHIERDEAIITLRESSQYGVGMFPDAGFGSATADDDDESIVDRIVMERAKVRRLELEKEEKIEEMMWKEERERESGWDN